MLDFIQVTAQYSNAVLVAILPHISEFCQKIEIPISTPVTLQQVQKFGCSADKSDPGGVVVLTNGYIFGFSKGIVDTFRDPQRFFGRAQHPNSRSRFYGELTMNRDEALQFARATFTKLGYLESDLFIDGDPCRSWLPLRYGTNVIPYYEFVWGDPRDDSGVSISCSMEIDAANRRPTLVEICPSAVWKPAPKITIVSAGAGTAEQPDPESRKQATQVPSEVLNAISSCARSLNLQISLPIKPGQIAQFDPKHRLITLTNGYEFVFAKGSNGYIREFKGQPALYAGPMNAHVSEYWGEWGMSKSEAIQLARQTLDRLGYWKARFYNDAPKVKSPKQVGKHTIPRYYIQWTHIVSQRDGEAALADAYAAVEIDAASKTVKSFSVFRDE